MKNIHILPTDKPSRIRIGDNRNFVIGSIQTTIVSKNDSFTNQNLYITSDEEIKVGDWFIDIFNVIHQTTQSTVVLNTYKNIVLTTDQDLIKDGVQAIDDDFLEWFVKNPSCEWVEIDLIPLNEFGSEITVNSYGFDKFKYKITIPKEEPKQERMYSEEDLEKAFKEGFTLGYVGDTLIAEKDKCFNRWFKIFKDK